MILSLSVALLIFRTLLPSTLLYFVNNEIQNSKKITGKIQDLELGVLSGRIVLHGTQIAAKSNRDFDVNLGRTEVNLRWWPLKKGRLKFDLKIVGALVVLNIGGPSKKTEDLNKEYEDLRREFRATWPTYLNSLNIDDLNVRIIDRSDLAIPIFRILETKVHLEGVSNRPENQFEPARLVFDGRTSGKGIFAGYLLFSGIEANPGLKGEIKLRKMDLRFLNPFFRKHANLDLESGRLDLFLEFAVQDWRVDGYVKPILSEIKFIDLDKKKEKGFWRILWEQMLTFVAWVLKNEKTDQIAAKIRFSGQLDGPDTNPVSAFGTLVRNAFIEAIQSGFDRDLKIKPRLLPKKKTP